MFLRSGVPCALFLGRFLGVRTPCIRYSFSLVRDSVGLVVGSGEQVGASGGGCGCGVEISVALCDCLCRGGEFLNAGMSAVHKTQDDARTWSTSAALFPSRPPWSPAVISLPSTSTGSSSSNSERFVAR